MSQARRRIFLAITLLVPVLVFGSAELVLRVAGIGRLEPLFIPVPADARYLQPNPAFVRRFFPDPRDAPDVSIDTTWFLRDKSQGLVRIFVLGESSAAGPERPKCVKRSEPAVVTERRPAIQRVSAAGRVTPWRRRWRSPARVIGVSAGVSSVTRCPSARARS